MGGAKTGMADRMRTFMIGRKRPFTPAQAADALGVPPGPERQLVRNCLIDFWRRGEAERAGNGKYRYRNGWRPTRNAPTRERILKAMHVSVGGFTVADIQRLADHTTRSYIDHILAELMAGGYVKRGTYRLSPGKPGRETLWIVPDRERFRADLMK